MEQIEYHRNECKLIKYLFLYCFDICKERDQMKKKILWLLNGNKWKIIIFVPKLLLCPFFSKNKVQ